MIQLLTRTIFAVSLPVLLIACGGPAPDRSPIDESLLDTEFSYEDYNALLHDFVDDAGLVDYVGLLENKPRVDAFVASLNNVAKSDFDAWSRNEKMAFWLNAYNAVTLKYIIDSYPIEKGSLVNRARFPQNSIRQIDGVWTELTSNVLGAPITLDAIEHEILRPEFEDPRIHMAIVCASIGCPPLRAEAFSPEALDAQLDDQSRTFLADAEKFRIDKEEKRVYISSIFEWFGEDFTATHNKDDRFTKFSQEQNAVLSFISEYTDTETADYLKTQDYKISYLDYDWSLNEQ